MRWLVAGCAFAAVVVLALWTAVLRGHNTRRRLDLLDGADHLRLLRIVVQAEAREADRRTELDRLLLEWARMRRLSGVEDVR